MSHRYLVLGLLSEAPMTGYEIKKRVGKHLKSVTNASYGTLYPTLHRLLAEGAVHMEEKPQAHRPARKVYDITERGLRELEEWLRQPAEPDHIRRDFLLKLFMARNLPPADMLDMLLQRRDCMETQLAEQEQATRSLNGNTPPNQVWVSEYVVEMCKAELVWLSRVIAQIESALQDQQEDSERLNPTTKVG
jgi:PadR family transcriptional regulator AphA